MGDKHQSKLWIFSNNSEGTYEGQEWDLNFTFQKHGYYFLEKEPSRTKVAEGDIVYLRVFGDSYIGKCRIAGPWKPDPDGPKKYETKTGFFPIDELIRWKRPLPQSLIIRDLSTADVRHRIIPIESADGIKIETAQRVYERLGFGGADGQIVVLEKGIEEAIKPNLASLGLKLADDSIQQQFAMGPGVGRSDLICTDRSGDLVVIELKRGMASDEAIGQVLRYIGYVRENIASPTQKVHGWIVAGDYDEHLRLSASAADIKILMVRLG